MIYGVISLLGAQLIVLALTMTAYLRIRSHSDAEKHDRMAWGIKVEAAVSTADAAKRTVEMIEVSHYNALRAKFDAQALEIATLEKEVLGLRAEVVGLRVKLATEARTERMKKKRETEEEEDATLLAQAERNGTAFPLPLPATPQPSQPPRTFGKIP